VPSVAAAEGRRTFSSADSRSFLRKLSTQSTKQRSTSVLYIRRLRATRAALGRGARRRQALERAAKTGNPGGSTSRRPAGRAKRSAHTTVILHALGTRAMTGPGGESAGAPVLHLHLLYPLSQLLLLRLGEALQAQVHGDD